MYNQQSSNAVFDIFHYQRWIKFLYVERVNVCVCSRAIVVCMYVIQHVASIFCNGALICKNALQDHRKLNGNRIRQPSFATRNQTCSGYFLVHVYQQPADRCPPSIDQTQNVLTNSNWKELQVHSKPHRILQAPLDTLNPALEIFETNSYVRARKLLHCKTVITAFNNTVVPRFLSAGASKKEFAGSASHVLAQPEAKLKLSHLFKGRRAKS